jgi:hypothetical protein
VLSSTEGNSGSDDFDFIIGDWTVQHRRLNSRLTGCTEWTEFTGEMSTRKVLGGSGNIEANVLYLPEGSVNAVALRSYDAISQTWAIWWLDGRSPHRLDVPVVGAFSESTGVFFANDAMDGRPITIRFIWRANPGEHPRWEQAFSDNDGTSWETNWTMVFRRSAA